MLRICLRRHFENVVPKKSLQRQINDVLDDIFATIVVANTIATTYAVSSNDFASNYLRQRASDYMSSQKEF